MMTNISRSLIFLAAQEGKYTAIEKSESLLASLETLAEVGSFDEKKAAVFLAKSVKRAIEEILDGTLVKLAARDIETDDENELRR